MKHKISLLLTIGALAFGSTAVGLVGGKGTQVAKAATTDTVVLRGIIGGVNYWEGNYRAFSYNNSTSRFELTVLLNANDKFKLFDSTANKWAGYHTDLGTTVVKGESGAIGDNIVALGTGNYTISVADFSGYGDANYIFESGTGSISYTAVASYNITEYAVVGGVKEDTALATETAYDGVTFTPTDVNRTGYLFGGWFTDSTCATAYSATTWNAAGNLYAKYTAVTDRTVFFGGTSWANTFVYSFGGDQEFGAWPGTKITTITDGVSYQGKYAVRKVVLAKNDSKIIFNDGTGGTKGTTQTNDLKIVDKAYYWVDAADGSTGDADKGLAAAVVYDINAARKAVVASGDIKVASICGISKATATTLIDEYDGLNDTAKGYVDAATDYVYNYADTSKGVDVSFTAIIAQLRLIAAKPASNPAAGVVLDNNTTPVLVMVISLSVAALAAGGLWMSRRKEH